MRAMLEEGAPPGVTVEVDAEAVTVKPSKASAVGVIVSEFVMNAFKHGFPEGRASRVMIKLQARESMLKLVCRDDGVGSVEVKPSRRGLGVRLIQAYAT